MFRPGFLRGAERTDSRIAETLLGYVNSHFGRIVAQFRYPGSSQVHSRMFHQRLKLRYVSSHSSLTGGQFENGIIFSDTNTGQGDDEGRITWVIAPAC